MKTRVLFKFSLLFLLNYI